MVANGGTIEAGVYKGGGALEGVTACRTCTIGERGILFSSSHSGIDIECCFNKYTTGVLIKRLRELVFG